MPKAANTSRFVDQIVRQIQIEGGSPDPKVVAKLIDRVFGHASPNRPFADDALSRRVLGGTREILDGPFGEDYLKARGRCEEYLGKTRTPIIEVEVPRELDPGLPGER